MIQTKDTLKKLVHTKLSDMKLVIVSNREPYLHTFKEGKIECLKPAGGVVTALDPIMKTCKGTWVGYGSGDADKRTADKNGRLDVPPEDPQYTLRRVWLTKEEEKGYYYGFSNEAIWPLCHIAYARPTFGESDWLQYQRVNQHFADAVLEEVGKEKAFVFIQDYHLALLPRYLKEKRPDLMVVHFWHIPWPNPEVFRVCPKAKEILHGLLGNDLLGFHIRYHCLNFLDTVDRTIEARADRERTSVFLKGHETLVRAFPISVDFKAISDLAATADVENEIKTLKQEYAPDVKYVMFGLDRLDYTKGITERLHAIDRFLDKYPEYKEQFVFIQVGDLSRIHIKKYRDLNDEINALVEDINWKHSQNSWNPIVMMRRHLSYIEVLAFFRLADAMIVSSLHDGMNLVAKEFISSRVDNSGVLLLSQFTGAAREFPDAVLINPYDVDAFADGIKTALEMPKKEKEARIKKMRRVAAENNIYKWACNIILELGKLQLKEVGTG